MRQDVGLHLAVAAWCDRGSTTRNDPCDRSGPNAAHRHQGAGRVYRRHLHQVDERAAEELDCHQAVAESCDHQQARRADHSVMRQEAGFLAAHQSGELQEDAT